MGMEIGSAGGCSGGMQSTSFSARMNSSDAAKLVDQAFSKIDTKNQGYVDQAELETALGQMSGTQSSDSSSSADAILKAFDGDSDGKITKDEMTAGLQKLASSLDSQFDASRVHGAGQASDGPPQPPRDGEAQSASDASSSASAKPHRGHHSHAHGTGSEDPMRQAMRLVTSYGAADTKSQATVSVSA